MLKRLLILGLFALPATAAVNPPVEGLYGPEFTFTFNGQVPAGQKLQYLRRLREHLIQGQPDGAKFTEGGAPTHSPFVIGNAKFTSPNGWWFEVTDNPGVLEIKMGPLTVAETRRFKDDIQDAIFVSAANVGLFPWDYLGGGHLNFDLRVFGGNFMLARNFVADFWSHSELSMGILSFDTNNAVPLAIYTDEDIAQIREILAKADTGGYPEGEEGIYYLFEDLDEVLKMGGVRIRANRVQGKHHDLNFGHRGRVEIRAVRPQANMDVWLNQIELVESRINNYLRHIEQPLPLEFRVPVAGPESLSNVTNGQLHVPPVDPQLALRSFYAYVTESGLDWKNHRGYVWPPWIQSGELEKFEAGDEFKNLECAKGLVSHAR